VRSRPLALLALSLVGAFAAAGSAAAAPTSQTAAPGASRAVSPACPWARPTPGQSDAELAAEVVARMTLREKLDVVTLISTKAYENSTVAVPALCVPALTMEDGPAGLAYQDTGVTQFPAPIGLAATFDTALAREEGAAVASQARAQGVDALQGPYLNLARVPEGGRVFEGFGEDPALTAAMGVANIEGIQAAGVLADAKDLGVYTQETTRDFLNQLVPERALQELYLAPFRAAVQDAQAASLMCGFGQINGTPTCQDPAIFAAVRSWGTAGFVRDDINAAPDALAAFQAGLDLIKPSPWAHGDPALSATGLASIDEAARRVLGQMFRFGLIQQPRVGTTSTDVQTTADQRVALQVAERSAVLLKNAGGVLPLGASPASIAVIGTGANAAPISSGGGSSHVAVTSVVTPLRAIEQRWPHAQVVAAPGEPAAPPATEIPSNDVSPPLPVPPPPPKHPVYHTTAPPTGTWRSWSGLVSAPATGLYQLSVLSHGGTQLSIDGVGLLDDPGAHGPTLDQVAYNFAAGHHYRITMRWFGYDGNVPKLGWQDTTPMIQQAVTAARHAQVAIVFAGSESTEGADNTTLDLSGIQDQLIEAVAAANPDTVVVLDTGGAVLMPWLPQVQAVLEAWYPGQADGSAVAALLAGDVDPGGKLPVTFPTSDRTTSVSSSRALWPGVAGTVNLAASGGGGLDIGYRWYEAHHVPVLFPFGYGLSYTTFSLSHLALARSGSGYVASLTVRNTGASAGSEVVQAYLRFPVGAGEPPLQLAAFGRASLGPGRSATVRLTVPASAFSIWRPSGFSPVPGRYALSVGDSSAELPLTVSLAAP